MFVYAEFFATLYVLNRYLVLTAERPLVFLVADFVLNVCITNCKSDGLVQVFRVRFQFLRVAGFDLL